MYINVRLGCRWDITHVIWVKQPAMAWTILNDSEDKTNLPNYLKDLYSREPQQVHSLLSTLINPKDTKNKLDVEKCLWVICGGQKPEDFTRIIKANDRSVICGLVWDANFIAYRCKTCGITPCMSLCAECFENGDHEGHDFNMFRSGAGKWSWQVDRFYID